MRYALALHVLISQAEMELWESFADRCRLEVDDAVHAAALSGLKYQLAPPGDAVKDESEDVATVERAARRALTRRWRHYAGPPAAPRGRS